MQFRQLRYFVKIVEAGSFSRAATTIHVAQPALSQQIAELEDRLGIMLLQRSARGVKPTPAGDVLYREASSILRQLEQLPGIIRSANDDPEGVVSVGIAASLAPRLVGGILDECRSALPKVTIRVSDSDSTSLEARVSTNTLDLAVLYEDELVPAFQRQPLFRQKMYLVSRKPLPEHKPTMSLKKLDGVPLVLPSPTNGRRDMIDRILTAAGFRPNIVLEADALTSEILAVRNDVGCTILPVGDMSHFGDFAQPILIEPGMHLTCSIVSSSDFPLTHAGEAVRSCLFKFIEARVRRAELPGADWIGKK